MLSINKWLLIEACQKSIFIDSIVLIVDALQLLNDSCRGLLLAILLPLYRAIAPMVKALCGGRFRAGFVSAHKGTSVQGERDVKLILRG